jgi:hypothetical protein
MHLPQTGRYLYSLRYPLSTWSFGLLGMMSIHHQPMCFRRHNLHFARECHFHCLLIVSVPLSSAQQSNAVPTRLDYTIETSIACQVISVITLFPDVYDAISASFGADVLRHRSTIDAAVSDLDLTQHRASVPWVIIAIIAFLIAGPEPISTSQDADTRWARTLIVIFDLALVTPIKFTIIAVITCFPCVQLAITTYQCADTWWYSIGATIFGFYWTSKAPISWNEISIITRLTSIDGTIAT